MRKEGKTAVRGERDGKTWRVERELLYAEAWQKHPRTNTNLEGRHNLTLFKCALRCRACRNGRSAAFQIIPHTGGSTLSLFIPPSRLGWTHTPSVTLVSACMLESTLTETDNCTCLLLHCGTWSSTNALNLQLPGGGGANCKFYQWIMFSWRVWSTSYTAIVTL